ncbi:MAG: hypothetical protein U0235_20350 [Polyangiaceae bacterium]
MKFFPTQMQRTYSSNSMPSWSVMTSVSLALYAAKSWSMFSTRVTCFQPPPSAGFKNAGKRT